MGIQKAIPGYHMVTTLDLDLQRVAEAAFPDSVRGPWLHWIREMVKFLPWSVLRDWILIFFL
jgi:cell division protein FtsI/penicillin-binding protein 2